MKKWIRFFFLSFFSDKISKEGIKRGYTNVFLGFLLALAFLWAGFIGGEMLPFPSRYSSSEDFRATARAVLANPDADKRISARIEDGLLRLGKRGEEYTEVLLVNTFESETDKRDYSVNGYNVVVDPRPADTLAEVEAYLVSNDGKSTVISYQDYLGLSDVAKLNFDFRLRYTGNALELTDEAVEGYRAYVDGLSEENRLATEGLAKERAEGKITESEYGRAVYELYFASYYPAITDYESSSRVPLLRNYYYHQYISQGVRNYLFIFDDYLAASFETSGGREVSFYGFYSELEDGALVAEGATQDKADEAVDSFIKESYKAIGPLNSYAYAMNIFSLIPFIALMLMAATLLPYSILKLRGVEGIASLGAMFKIVGSYVWFSGAAAALLTVIASFFVRSDMITALPQVLFFVTLAARSIVFAVRESGAYFKRQRQQEAEQTEV